MPCSPIASALLTVLALSLGASATPRGNAGSAVGKAVYFMTNDGENAVVAVPIRADGKLSGGTQTSTGGRGSVSIDGAMNAPAAKDGLVSQSSLSIAGNVSRHSLRGSATQLLMVWLDSISSPSTPGPTQSPCLPLMRKILPGWLWSASLR